MKNVQITKPVVSLSKDKLRIWVLDIGQYAHVGSHKSMQFYATKTASLIYESREHGTHSVTEYNIYEPSMWEWIGKWMNIGMDASLSEASKTVQDLISPLAKLYRNSVVKPGAIAVTPEQFDAICDLVKTLAAV